MSASSASENSPCLNGLEYAGYISYNGLILNEFGEESARYTIEEIDGESFKRWLYRTPEEAIMYICSAFGGDPYRSTGDIWTMGEAKTEPETGFIVLYVPLPDRKGSEIVIPSLYYKDLRFDYQELGGASYICAAYTPPFPLRNTPEGQKRPSNEVCEAFAKILLKRYKGEEVECRYNFPEMERRKKILEQRELEQRMANQPWLDRKLNLGFGHAAETIAALGLEIPQAPGKIPNVNEGIHESKDLAERLSRALARSSAKKAALVNIHEDGIWKELSFLTGGNTRIRVVVACTYNISQAFRMIYSLTEAEFPDDADEDEILLGEDILDWAVYKPAALVGMLEQAEGVVGEYAIRRKQLIGEDGLPVKGSEKRSIYFTRGNTAVAVLADDPSFDVLPAARAIDKLLVEGMRKAGEPLTREQDYLKEEKKQK